MIDTHNHILFDIDDGCRNIEESIILLKQMEELEFKKIILTPHYINGTKYTINNLIYLYMTSIILGGFLYLLNVEFSYKHIHL